MKVVKYIPLLMLFILFSCKKDTSLSFKNIHIGCPTDSIEYYISQDENSSIGYFDTISLMEYPSFMLREDYDNNRRDFFLDYLLEKKVYVFKTKIITLDDKIIPTKCCIEIKDNKVFRIVAELIIQDSGRSDFLSIKNLYHDKYGRYDFWHSNGKKQDKDMILDSYNGHNEGGYVWEWKNQRIYLRESYTKKTKFSITKYDDIKYSIIYENILAEKVDINKYRLIQKRKEKIVNDENKKEIINKDKMRLEQDI